MSQPWARHPPEVLPAVVCEGPVRLGHLVSVFTALHRCTETVGCVQDLVGEPLGHRLLAAIFCIAGEPAQRKGVGWGEQRTRRERTSSVGRTLSSAFFSVATASCPDLVVTLSSASYTMRCARSFLPSTRILLTSWLTTGEPYTGSAMTGRLGAGPLRGITSSPSSHRSDCVPACGF